VAEGEDEALSGRGRAEIGVRAGRKGGQGMIWAFRERDVCSPLLKRRGPAPLEVGRGMHDIAG